MYDVAVRWNQPFLKADVFRFRIEFVYLPPEFSSAVNQAKEFSSKFEYVQHVLRDGRSMLSVEVQYDSYRRNNVSQGLFRQSVCRI